MRFSVAFAQGEDAHAVGYEAAQRALGALGDETPAPALLFASVRYNPEEVYQGVRAAFGKGIALAGR